MLLRRRLRVLAAVVLALSGGCLVGCETSKSNDPLANLTDEEIERLEQEIRELPEGSIILKLLERYI
jgi:hypothetical protein